MCTRHFDRRHSTWTLLGRELRWRRTAVRRLLVLMSHRSLQLLLLRFAHQWWLPRKCLLKVAEKVGNVRPIPHADPIS